MTSRRRTGLGNIRTMSATPNQTSTPQKKLQKLASLAEEKHRRTEEKRRVLDRIEELDEQLAKIDAREAQLLNQLSDPPHKKRPASRQPTARNQGGITLKY